MYKRRQLKILTERINEPRRFIQVISGPRQVGKSTLVMQFRNETSISCSLFTADTVNPTDKEWIANIWESVRQIMAIRHERTHILIIDEIHKIKNWSEQVKREWDTDTAESRDIKVIILGSSRLLLKKGLTESLMGRFEIIYMPHWSYSEMHDAFGWDVNQFIYFGGYPGSAGLIHDEERWLKYMHSSVISPSVEKDVIQTSAIYKPALMKSLFELGCSYSGKELSLNKILGQLQDAGNITTLSNYLELLKESWLLAGLNKFAMDKARKYNSIPKYQVFNSALLTATGGWSYEKDFIDPSRWGRWVETAVGVHLINSALSENFNLYYWREGNEEVDFIIEKRGEIIAIEVKSGHRTSNKGLQTVRRLYSPKLSFVVGSNGIPIDEFLRLDISSLWNRR